MNKYMAKAVEGKEAAWATAKLGQHEDILASACTALHDEPRTRFWVEIGLYLRGVRF